MSLIIETLDFEKPVEPIFLSLRGIEVQLPAAEAIRKAKSDWIEVLSSLRIFLDCSKHDMYMLKAVACSFVLLLRLFSLLVIISTSEFVEIELTISNFNTEPFEFVCFGL